MAAEGRPRRASAYYGGVRPAAESAESVIRRGYAAFVAAEGDGGDGEQSCSAHLFYDTEEERVGVAGTTGKGHGHAEMDALHTLFTDKCRGDIGRLRALLAAGVTVRCESKPCCLHCSTVLGLLGIRAATAATGKARVSMGSTQWTLPPVMRAVVAEIAGISEGAINEFWRTSSI